MNAIPHLQDPAANHLQMRLPGWKRAWVLACFAAFCGFALTPSPRAADTDIVLNELMYHPPDDLQALQWVELWNRGRVEVDLSRWSFVKGIKYSIPEGTRLGPGMFLVICRDLKAFTAHYGPAARALGNFEGQLSHKSERIELVNAARQRVDAVKYSDADGWPKGADGYSSSLERINPFGESDLPQNWAASNWPEIKRAAGTPGQRNDSFATNLPPMIDACTFTPRTPAPQQPVKVTVRVADADGVQGVVLLYRVASTGRESEEKAVPMTRTAGDEKSGVYEARIEGQAHGQLVRFRIKATDSAHAERVEPGANEPRPAYSYFSFTNTATAKIPQGFALNIGRMDRGPAHYQQRPARKAAPTSGLRGRGAFFYVPADGSEPETFDYVHLTTRSGGFKVHFLKDQRLKGMSGINLILEGSVRWILAEPLAYSVYRLAGVPAPLTEHVRLAMDGRLLGFHLLIEQPNKAFLERNERNPSGNLYKLIWYGQGIIGQHEKKTNLETGHADLIQTIEGLRGKSGAAQWAFISEHFNVEECASYYAVNMCIQNWDGFFNNYYAFHDMAKSGKWEIFPWDEDKTWGDYDGASPRYDWYDMPLTMGMNGDRSPGALGRFGGGPFGGVSWWRPAGYFSGPLLANPEFRKRFLNRLQELCTTVFTEESFFPIIDAMEKRLEPEVRVRAQLTRQDPQQALREFSGDMQSFREQVRNRRKFILTQLGRAR